MAPTEETPEKKPDEEFSIIPRRYRAYLYRIATAVTLASIGLGLATQTAAYLALGVVAAVIGLPMAVANTSTK